MKPATTFRTSSGSWPRWLTAAGILTVLALSGCGTAGPEGNAGSDGAAGKDPTGGITTATTLTAVDNSPGIKLVINGVGGQSGVGDNGTPFFNAQDRLSVTFTITKNDGKDTPWYLSEMATGTIILSGPTGNYQAVIPHQDDLITNSVANGNGKYTYTFPVAVPGTYQAPINSSAAFGAIDGKLTGQPLEKGTYTVGMAVTWNYTVDGVAKMDAGNATKDIFYGSTGTAQVREVVKDDNCNSCHVAIQGHEGAFRTTKLCILCHTAGAEDFSGHGTSIEFKVLMHKLHNGSHLPSVNGVTDDDAGLRSYTVAKPMVIVTEEGETKNFSGVNFPVYPSAGTAMPRRLGYSLATTNQTKETALLKGVVACAKCHGDSGTGAPAQGVNCYTVPSMGACGACHDDINWTKSHQANGMTMPQQNPGTAGTDCSKCHQPLGNTLADGKVMTDGGAGTVPPTNFAHVHPMSDPTRTAKHPLVDGKGAATYHNGTALTNGVNAMGKDVTTYTSGLNIAVTGVTGSAAATYFVAGEKPKITFALTDDAGNPVPLHKLSSLTTLVSGPNNNRQAVFPMSGSRGNTATLLDFAGRLVYAPAVTPTSTAPKGTMSRVVGSTVKEALKVQFAANGTDFVVTGTDPTTGAITARGSASLAAATSTNPLGSSISNIELEKTAVPQNITVTFSSATAFTVTGAGGVISPVAGTANTMPAATNASTRFVSDTIAFTITSAAVSTANPTPGFVNGSTFNLTVFKTSSGGHMFAIVAGRGAFSANDRFYYETVDNTQSTYTYNVPMDIVLEYKGPSPAAGADLLPVANPGAYWGREVVFERTNMMDNTAAASTTTAGASATVNVKDAMTLTVLSAAGFAAGDLAVLNQTATNGGEPIVITAVNGNVLSLLTPLKNAYANGKTCVRTMRESALLANYISATNTAATPAIRDRFITVADASAYVANDYVVLDQGAGVGTEEYLQINKVVTFAPALGRSPQIWFNTPLRYAHAVGAKCKKVNLTQRLEGIDYTLNPVSGVITIAAAATTNITAGNAIVVNYRTDGAFGWRRHYSAPTADALQAVYQPPLDDSPALGQDWGDWQGLPYQAGTYRAAIWGVLPVYVTKYNETQAYSISSRVIEDITDTKDRGNFLYGSSGTKSFYNLISSEENCEKCHDQITVHGSRRGHNLCAMCHGIAGSEDSSFSAMNGVTVNFRTMLHKVHMGSALTNASSYTVSGTLFGEAVFPAMPGISKVLADGSTESFSGSARKCDACHGTSDKWSKIVPRVHANQTTPTRNWMTACNSCHDSATALLHTNAMTSAGSESCETCHAAGKVFGIDVVHKAR